MNALDELDSLIAKGVVIFVTVGVSHHKEGRAHASLCLREKLSFVQGYGATTGEAISDAIENAFRRGVVPTPAIKHRGDERTDELDDLLG